MIKRIKTHKGKEYLSTDAKRKLMITKWIEKYCPTSLDEMCLDEGAKVEIEYTREAVLPKGEIEKLALEMVESGSNDAVKVKMAELVVASIRNMSIEEIKTIRNFTEKEPANYVKFDI